MAKVYRIVARFADVNEEFDEADDIQCVIENVRWPNHCLDGIKVEYIETRDIGEWSDNHPLNRSETAEAEWDRLFQSPTSAAPESPVAEAGALVNSEPDYKAHADALAEALGRCVATLRKGEYSDFTTEQGEPTSFWLKDVCPTVHESEAALSAYQEVKP